jgi:hypothetical protein
MQADIVLDK